MLGRNGRNSLKRKRRGDANPSWHYPRPALNLHRPPARVPQNQTIRRLNRLDLFQVTNLPRHPPLRAVYHRHLRSHLQNLAKAKQVTERTRRMNSSFYLNDINDISVLPSHPSPQVMVNHPQKVATVAGD